MAMRVVCYGLGPIGLGIARLAQARKGIEIVGAVDIDAAKKGRDLGELLDIAPVGVLVSTDASAVLEQTKPDVVLHATGSALERVLPQFQALVRAGVDVVSTCEELSFPWKTQHALIDELHALAQQHQVTLLGTGINPGYAMDALPLMLTAPCAFVRSVKVLRVVDAARRRGPLQRKVGAGLSTEAFAARVADGSVRHVGLPESLQMLAAGLGWNLDQTDDLIEPMIAEQQITTDIVHVEPGQVAGVRQVARGLRNGEEVLRLELRMYVGARDPQDTVTIDGEPPVHMTIAGGLHGDIATAAMMINVLPSLRSAAPGVVTMSDIALPRYWE